LEGKEITFGDIIEFGALKALEDDVRLVGEFFKYCFISNDLSQPPPDSKSDL